MEPLIKTYSVKVVRESGRSPVTGQLLDYEEQSFGIDATSVQAAHHISNLVCTLKFKGQLRRTYIDGKEHFDERF